METLLSKLFNIKKNNKLSVGVNVGLSLFCSFLIYKVWKQRRKIKKLQEYSNLKPKTSYFDMIGRETSS